MFGWGNLETMTSEELQFKEICEKLFERIKNNVPQEDQNVFVNVPI